MRSDLRLLSDLSISPPFIDIISLRMSCDEYVFVRLSNASSCAYVRMLRGDWLGFALKGEISVPHILNWRTSETHALDIHSIDFKMPALSIAFWREFVVVALPCEILIYSLPSESNAPVLLRTLALDDPATCAVVIPQDSIAVAPNDLPQTDCLIAVNDSIFSLRVGIDECASEGSFSLTPMSDAPENHDQWFPRQGSAGRRLAYLTEGGYIIFDLHTCAYQARKLSHNGISAATLAWGFPTHDFDDALGVFVLGDVFGKITLFDVVNSELHMRNDAIGTADDLIPLSKVRSIILSICV